MGRREWYRSVAGKGEREASAAAGCMSGMLQFFDFHHILCSPSAANSGTHASSHFHLQQQQQQHCPSQQLKGVEAPRNSLELDETAAATTMSTASAFAEEYYGVPIGIQVKAAPSLAKKQSKKDLEMLVEEEKRTSTSQCGTPRSTTPNVVARLMGLEILPDGASTPMAPGSKSLDHSPKFGTKKNMNEPPRRQPLQKRDPNVMRLEVGTRSLPDTPRASSERSREDPRLSLQLNSNKENAISRSTTYAHSLPPSPVASDEYTNRSRRSRSDGCKTQVDENRSSRGNYYAKEIVKQAKENIHRRGNCNDADDKRSLRSRRPPTDKRVVVVENESKHCSASSSPPPARLFEPPKLQAPPKLPRLQQSTAPSFKAKERVEAKPIKMEASKCKKPSYEKFTERIKKQPAPSETATQSVSPSSPVCSHPNNLCSKEQDAEFLYVRSILERAGMMASNKQAIRWYSPSLPIDPFVFHQLELDRPSVRHRSDRKLLFHLVEEILSELLSGPTKRTESPLLDRLWSQIRRFPRADCRVVEDIDALVAGDLAEARVRRLLRHPLVAAEAEGVAREIEADVLDSVVGEAAATLALCSRRRP